MRAVRGRGVARPPGAARYEAAFLVAAGCLAIASLASGWMVAGAEGLVGVTVTVCVLTLLRLARDRLPVFPHPPPRPGLAPRHDPYSRYRGLYNRLSWGQVSAPHFDRNTRPALTRVTAARLLERRGIDLEREPPAAREALGDRLYALVDPARPDATDRAADAVPLGEVARLVQRLEDL
ncbi:hypothetical protein AB0M28_10895 [Streptomyces sp. NPDC051940]|uniref:hypothetical protein n=1 Tax=Streptomyces sp. NPDC051940 TaxID=3155675 RepID=UPI00343B56A3